MTSLQGEQGLKGPRGLVGPSGPDGVPGRPVSHRLQCIIFYIVCYSGWTGYEGTQGYDRHTG